MNIKKNFLFLILGLLMTFLLPNYANAASTFSAIDNQGKLLYFGGRGGSIDKPSVYFCPTGTTCAPDGNGSAPIGAKYKYTNVYTDPATNTRVDAIVEVLSSTTGASITKFDDPAPNSALPYSFAASNDVAASAVFGPQVSTTTVDGHVDFLITFQNSSGVPVVLLNVYNNSIDIDGKELIEYGGFQSYEMCSSNCGVTPDGTQLRAAKGVGTNIRFTGTGDYPGLELNEKGRVQTFFNSIVSLKISMGATGNTGGMRQYGSIFMKRTTGTGVFQKTIAPTVNLLTTTDTKPTITGTIGGRVSAASPNGSALSGSDIFSVVVNGTTYSTTPTALTSTQTAGKLTVSGTTWSLEFLTPLAINTAASVAYEVTATRNGVLVDQTSNELVVIDTCTGGKAWDSVTSTCVMPSSVPTKVLLCHSGNGKNYAKILIAASGMNGHETHEFDEAVDANGLCPGEVIDCTSQIGKVANAAGTACILPVAPTVTSTTSTDLIPVAISGGATTSNKILSVTLTKIKDGLGATVSGATASAIGTNLTVTNNVWTVSSGAVAVGTYTITAKDGNNLSGTGTFTVGCLTGKVATATACITPVAPTVTSTTSTDLIPVPISGGATTSNTISSVTLTKIKDGLGATVSGATASTIGTNLTVTNNAWTVSSGAMAVGTYTITAKDGNNLSGTGTFTVGCPTGKTATALSCIALVPTVISQTTADTTPTITGTVGSSALVTGETFTVLVNGVTYTNGDGKLSASGTTWTLNVVAALTAGITYPVTATRGGTSTATGNVIVVSNPTVVSQSTSNSKPTITGTVGNAVLNTIGVANETFTVTINGTTYSNGVGGLTVTGMNWSLIIPTALPVGTYEVVALRDGKLADTTTNEIVISGTEPTVTALSTNDTTPTIMGTFGTNDLGATEAFTVTVNGVTYTKGDGNLVALNSSWSLTIPAGKELKNGVYEVDAVRNNLLHDLSLNELTIAIAVPTIEKQTLREKLPIVIKGTVGDVALDTSETFTVVFNNKTYTKGTDANLVISAMAWTLTIPTTEVIAAGTYEIVATRSGTLVDSTTGELVITPLSPPTVTVQITFDTTPIIRGTVGSVALDTGELFTVAINGKTYTNGTDASLVVSGTSWTLTIPTGSEIPGKATAYDVTATRSTTVVDTTSGELTIQPCALPKVVNAAGDQCIDPIPTINTKTVSTNLTISPTITGTVGEVALGSTETFTVTIPTTPPQIYTKGDAGLVINGINWTLTVPTAKALSPATYDIVAARNTTATDKTTGELIVNLVCITGETPLNGVCIKTALLPTVVSRQTDDTTPVITGTVGASALDSAESFSVTVDGTPYTQGDGNLIVTETQWQLTIPLANALSTGNHNVVAIRDTLEGTGVVTITECTKKVNDAGDCVDFSTVPTVTPSATHNISEPKIVVSGTIGDKELTASDTFNVTITEHGNSSHTLTGALVVTGTTWTFELTSKATGTFDVNAVRNSTADTTNSELQIGILVCQLPAKTDKTISLDEFNTDGGNNYVLGSCATAINVNPPNNTLDSFVPEEPGTGSECIDSEGGGTRSIPSENITNATIKRAKIINATSKNGSTTTAQLTNKILYYGVKESGTMNISSAKITGNVATGVTLDNVTLSDVDIYIDGQYFDAGSPGVPGRGFIPNDSKAIEVLGGTTDPSSNDKTRITDGVITSGTAGEIPVRGRIVKGFYNVQTSAMKTLGRWVKINTITGAVITGAKTTTTKMSDGSIKTVVENGDITFANPVVTVDVVETYGTALNAKIENATISDSNSCFSSGTVGARGQLNWKEVISE
jgi:hypothetical protein